MDTLELVNLALSGDQEAFTDAMNQAMAAKASDALELKKVEVASNIFGTEEDSYETTDSETDVGTDGDAADGEPADAEE